MNKTLIYDLPTRLFHWLFAGLFVGAFLIAKTVDDDVAAFSYHMMFGIMMSVLVILRIIWGFLGSRHAQFKSFELSPGKLIEYFKGLMSSGTKLHSGHNPASSWAAIAMFVLTFGLAFSGYMMTTGNEVFEEVHEVCATLFVLTAIGHFLGIIIHTIRHKDPIGLSMVTGAKNAPSADGISSSHPLVAVVLVVVVGYLGVHMMKNFDSNTRVLNLFGMSLQLGENEKDEGGHGNGAEKDGDDDD